MQMAAPRRMGAVLRTLIVIALLTGVYVIHFKWSLAAGF